ncbi:histidine kinase [Natronomonas halophila]|uniref:DICT sensory domain-containing protein n=1 Tax=Natronomonas halophila TaxID=2747817 RepID=UPI0015B6F5EC|nr:DICT sensory domain-containing protein [Natronomonas halophila]QLD85339.1 histidine kinase [Natronomonas halophila]
MDQNRPDSLRGFLTEDDVPERTLVVLNRQEPEPIQRLFEESFGALAIDIEERDLPDEADNVVALLEDGTVVATSPLKELQNAVLLVNADLYKTGTSGVDKYEAPDVLTALDEMVFSLRGFPKSNKEKLLLIVMSRFIENRALTADKGRLDVAFQELSRIRDERGTEIVYKRLAENNVETHIYGLPDIEYDREGLHIHTGTDEEYQRSWFVVYTPEDPNLDPAALLAIETGPNIWDAIWTYDGERVEAIQQYVIENF